MVTPEFLSWGGVGSYVMQLSKNLPSDYEVHVLCLGGEDGSDKDVGNVHVHSLGTAKDTFMYNNQFQLSLWRSFRDLQEAHGFDLVHANHAQMADIMLKLLGEEVPSVTTVHSTIGSQRQGTKMSRLPLNQLERSERMTFFLLPFLRAAERMYMNRCSSLIFVSEFIRDWCVERFGVDCPSQVIHNGIDTEMFSSKDLGECGERFPALQGKENIVLFSGRMIALKGIVTAIQAQAMLDPALKAHFVFAGNGDTGQWELLARSAGLPPERCTFLGSVKYEDMPYLYPLASAFILPSYSESFPLTILEAMASGVPVVATQVGGVPEMITPGRDGLLVPPRDARALSDAIGTVLSDPLFARQMCLSARTKVLEEFSAAVMAKRTAEVYTSTVEGWS